MGSDGGGGTTVTQNELPPEVRPIVSGAGNQVLALQGALPLTAFAGNDPQTMPGISAMQQEALRYAGNLASSTPTALTGLMSMAQPMGQVAQSMMNMSGRDVISPYMDPLAGISESLFNSASSPGSLAGRQVAFDVLSDSGRVAPVSLDGGGQSSGGRVDFSSARGGGGSGGAPAVPQLMMGGLPAGNGFQFNTNALNYNAHEAGGIANPLSMSRLHGGVAGPAPIPGSQPLVPNEPLPPAVMQQIVQQLPQSFPTLRPTGAAANPGRWFDSASQSWVDGTGQYYNEYGDVATGGELRGISPY